MMRRLLLLLAVAAFFTGCSIVDHSRMDGGGGGTPWNVPAEWENQPIMSN